MGINSYSHFFYSLPSIQWKRVFFQTLTTNAVLVRNSYLILFLKRKKIGKIKIFFKKQNKKIQINKSQNPGDTVTEVYVNSLVLPFRTWTETEVEPGLYPEHPLNKGGLQRPNNLPNSKRHVVKEEFVLCDGQAFQQNSF